MGESIQSIGFLIFGFGATVIVVFILFGLIKKIFGKKSIEPISNDKSGINLRFDTTQIGNTNQVRFAQIESSYTDKLNCYGASQNDRFLCLKIGLLHQENINYLCFGAKRKDLPLNQDSKIILHSESSNIQIYTKEKPYEFGRRYKNIVEIETKVAITKENFDWLKVNKILSISYEDSKNKLIRIFNSDSEKLNFMIIKFFDYILQLDGKLSFIKPEPVANLSTRKRDISQGVKDKVWNRDGGKCTECGSNQDLEFDHIIPFSKGGANTYRNIQLLCEKCNRKKSDKIG